MTTPRVPLESSSNTNLELQLQLHYLFKHLLYLAKGQNKSETATDIGFPED